MDIHIQCTDLPAALDFYQGQLDFRLDLIFPADNPRAAELSGYGITIRLKSEKAVMQTSRIHTEEPIIQVADDSSWGEGRAGMQYRDLIPGRLDGEFIASHIRIPTGGPVADYVHHHQVRFQMIYCYKGWVRVVYEDQGESFVMRAGDCVLQPPHIRHRVLESSDGLEVIEIGTPAEHETRVDHDLDLPNPVLNPNRDFDGQRFVFHQAERAEWEPAVSVGFELRDSGIAQATHGLANAVVLRPSGASVITGLVHQDRFFFSFILHGSLELSTASDQRRTLKNGDCFLIPANTPFTLSAMSPDLELLRVTLM